MLKIPENKTRKGLRITQCVLFLIEIFLCAMTYIHIPDFQDPSNDFYATVFDMLGYIGGSAGDGAANDQFAAFQSYVPFYFVFLIIPIVGFFFCALDKQRNLKNFVSLFCCLSGVLSILLIVTLNYIDFGSTFALIIYLAICFITAVAIMARLTKDNEEDKKPKKQKVSKYDREY